MTLKKLKALHSNIKALRNYNKRRVVLDNPPTFVWIEPTNHCNLKCIMCPNGAGMVRTEKGYLDYGLYVKIIDEIGSFASTIVLALGGESLLHPKFIDMVKYADKKRIRVCLNTNATMLNEEMSRLLLGSGLSNVSFAFDGFNKKTYESIRVGGDFEKTLNNILGFLRIRKKLKSKKPYTVLSILKIGTEGCKKNEKDAFLKQFDGLIDEIRLRDVSSWGNTFKDSDKFTHDRYDVLWTPCSRLWSSICVAWNGDVMPCIYNANHEYVVGNVKESRLLDIWNSGKMVNLRKAMIDETYLDLSPLCENCVVLGTPPIVGIPSGIRLTLADSITNIVGYRFESSTLYLANKFHKKEFSSVRVG